MANELHDVPSIEVMLTESMAELLLRKTHLAFALADVEGQLLTRTGPEDELSGWRQKAKTKAHYLRRAVAAVNNVISIKIEQQKSMWSVDDHGSSVLHTLNRLLKVWEAAEAATSGDVEDQDEETEQRLWEELAQAVEDAREIYFMVPFRD